VESRELPWEFVQDDVDKRLETARVLNARNELVCSTDPQTALVIVESVNLCAAMVKDASSGE
jgi:hypothetical protein